MKLFAGVAVAFFTQAIAIKTLGLSEWTAFFLGCITAAAFLGWCKGVRDVER